MLRFSLQRVKTQINVDMDSDVPCIDIHAVDTDQRCSFFLNTTNCHGSEGKLDYMFFIFCYFQQQSGVGVVLCVLWLFVLFIALGVTADDFLCPSLVVITKTLHLSQNIAGVTFLAFGNGAPDIFSSVAGIEQGRPELVIGTLFGAGVFVTSVVAGSIVASKPFKIMERPFLRDLIFYICASFWAFLRFYYGNVTIRHSVGFIILYIGYILVVIISRIIYNKYHRKKPEKPEQTISTIPTIEISTIPFENGVLPQVTFQPNPDEDDNPEAEGVVLRRFSFRGSIPGARKRHSSCHAHHEHVLKALTQAVEQRPDPTSKNTFEKHHRFKTQESKTSLSSLLSRVSDNGLGERIKEFFLHICPIDIEIWPERKWYHRILEIIKAPVCLLLVLTVPVVDYENENNNWCRLLNSLHCITSPMFILIATEKYNFMIKEVVPLWAVILIIFFMLSVIVFMTSSSDEPPCYHGVFGYAGFAASVIWVYLVASEIVSLLQALGIVFKLSDAILGLTVLAWGNSIGDFISNLSVARQGYPRMGISACYGGPLLNLLLGIGIPYTVAIVKSGESIELQLNKLICLLYGSLTFILVSTIVTMTIMKFNAKRYFGFFLLGCYFTFLVTAILLESDII